MKKKPSPFNYLCVAEKEGKVVDLFEADYTDTVKTYKCIWKNKGCEVSIYDVKPLPNGKTHERYDVEISEKQTLSQKLATGVFNANGKPWGNPVKCLDTGEVFGTVADCCRKMKMSQYNVRASIARGISVKGHRFDYVVAKPIKKLE